MKYPLAGENEGNGSVAGGSTVGAELSVSG